MTLKDDKNQNNFFEENRTFIRSQQRYESHRNEKSMIKVNGDDKRNQTFNYMKDFEYDMSKLTE